MFNLYQMVVGAQGGQGLETLAQKFGLTREQADSAVQALVPAISTAFMTKAAQPGGLGDIAGALTDDHHRQAYADPSVAGDPQTERKGATVAGSVFGDNAIVEQVIAQAARYTGLPEATLRSMLPVIVSMVLGGVATTMHGQGMGGMLGQLAHGGLGGILGQFGGAATGQGAPGNTGGMGSFAGMVGTIMNSFLGGAHPANPQEPVPPTHSGTQPNPSGTDPAAGLPPMVQAGLDMFAKMFEPGVPTTAAQPADLGATIDASHAAKR